MVNKITEIVLFKITISIHFMKMAGAGDIIDRIPSMLLSTDSSNQLTI